MSKPQYLPQILRQIFEGQENIIKFSPPKDWSCDWSQKLWLYLKQHFSNNLSQFEGLPVLPANETTFLQLSQSKPVLLASRRATYYMLPSTIKLPDDIVSIVTKLDVTLISSLPEYIEQHPCVLDNYVMLPDIGGVLNTLVAMAQQEFPSLSNTWQNWQYHKFEKLSAVEKIIFRKFISNVACAQSKSNFKNDWQNFCRHLQLFELDEEMENYIKKFTSIAMCSKMASKKRISSLPLLTNLLDASDTSAVTLASWFGIQPMSTEEVLVEIIFQNVTKKCYNKPQLEMLIEAIIPGYLNRSYKNNTISQYLRSLKFIPTNLGNLKSPGQLYDSSDDLLCKLLDGQDVFPSDNVRHYLPYLLKLGIKTQTNVTDVELLSVAKDIHQRPSVAKSEALLYFIKATISYAIRSELSQLNWLIITCERPKNYPDSLPWAGELGLFSSPNKILHGAYVDTCGSVCIFPRDHPNVNSIFDCLGGRKEPDVQSYIDHLYHVVENYNSNEKSQYLPIVIKVYEKFQTKSAREYLCLNANKYVRTWVWHGDGFCEPSRCFIDKAVRDMSPHAYCLPEEVKRYLDFFRRCGVRDVVNKMELLNWIAEWYEGEESTEIPAEQLHRDTQLVIKILNEVRDDIKSNKLKLSDISNQIFIPVEIENQSLSLVKPLQCTYYDGEWQKLQKDCVEYKDLQIIHRDIPIATAQCLGIPSLTSRLINAEELEFESYGQSEPLTTRLKNLIKDYSDGLSVLKEFVQNADDAGATEVHFLIDERENLNARRLLLDKKFSPCQGPAIVVYNNATFSDDDFRNIVKIGGATKETNSQKIGQFGLGFNAVYNITDVPCFLSSNFLAIFDPHMKYISNVCRNKSNPGVKISLDTFIKHSTVYGDQIKPFQNVFGCNIDKITNCYPGTLFRLPLRTPDEARESEICQKHYSRDDALELFKLLYDNGQNILMFTQNVKKIELYHLKKNDENPIQMKLLYKVTKTGLNKLKSGLTACCNEDFQFLKLATEAIKKQANGFQTLGFNFSLVIEIASIFTAEGNLLLMGKGEEIKSSTNWLISQAVGKGESFSLAKKQTKLLPVAGVAIKLTKCEKDYQPVRLKSPSEDPGLLFCFLPLPESPPALSVHVNGCFALSSSRRHLMTVNEKDKKDFRAQWNHALFVDAVIEAYINAVVDLRLIVGNNVNDIFSLWPIAEQNSKQFISLMTDKFYERIVLSDVRLFPHQNDWEAFQNCKILEGNFRFSSAGEIAQKVLRELSIRNRCGAIVELPKAQWFYLQALVEKNVKEKLISPLCFLKEYFLPNIEHIDRSLVDCLLIYALFTKDDGFSKCLKCFACIPVKPFGKFKYFTDLVHPYGRVAPLFKEEEECFPEWSEHNTAKLCKFYQEIFKQPVSIQKFCKSLYDTLVELGMKADDIPINHLRDKAISTRSHLSNLKPYCNAILQVLEKKINEKSLLQDDIDNFKIVPFLPVKTKPDRCPIKWFNDNCSSKSVASASSLFLEESTLLVCSVAPIVDENQVRISRTLCKMLGFKEKVISMDLIVEQLTAIYESIADCKQTAAADFDFMRNACHKIYDHLSQICNADIELELFNNFNDIPFILLGDKLIKPSLCSFTLKFSCDPYLFGLSDKPEYTKAYKQLMKYVGVKDTFNSAQYNLCLNYLHDKYGNSKLTAGDLQRAINVTLELVTALDKEEKNVEQLREPVYLPDENGILRESVDLVYNETPWLKEKQVGVNFINGILGYNILKRLGGKTLREEIICQKMLPFARLFGQKEKLTTRLQKIVSDYPNDESILRELLQNADDAGCSEIHFVLDPRHHKIEKVFSEEWKQLQGPSLLVLNDKCFSKEDLEGIQNLGEGGKGNDSLKTGRYGVGFNCVYHLSDCPSLLTSTPSTGPVLCIFDPHSKFIPSATPDNPGCLFNDVEQLKAYFPDAFSCYDDNLLPKQATTFRFPLRTEHLAKTSLISKKAVTVDQMQFLFEKFKKDAHDCLLFLRNVTTIKISTVDKSKASLHTFCVRSSLLAEDMMKRSKFNEKVFQYSKQVKQNPMNLFMKVIDNIISYELSILDSNNEQNHWLIVQQFGLSQTPSVKKEIESAVKNNEIGMLLQGGVALKLPPDITKKSVSNCEKMRVYCFLPLPLQTNLPVHINGFFALDHEARRGLFRDGDNSLSSYRSLWNVLLVEQVIAIAYVEMLVCLKEKLAANNLANATRNVIRSSLQTYLELFPTIDNTADVYINTLAKAVFEQMACGNYQLFPTLRSTANYTLPNVSWLSPVSDTVAMMPVFCSIGLNQTIKEILLNCGFNIVEFPENVYLTCKQTLREFNEVSPPMISEFFKVNGKFSSQSIIPALPKLLNETPLKISGNIIEILKYYVNNSKILPEMSDMQLLVTADGIQRCFSSHMPVFATPKFDLIPTRQDLFVNEDILKFLEGKEWKQASLKEFELNNLVELLPQYLSTEEWCDPRKRFQIKDDAIVKWIVKLWTFIGECAAKNRVTKNNVLLYLSNLHDWCLFPTLEKGQKKVLYPVGKAKAVIDLSGGDSTSQSVRDALDALGIPKPDYGIFSSNGFMRFITWNEEPGSKLVKMLAGDISDPGSIIYAIGNLLENQCTIPVLSLYQCNSLLNYFSSDLSKVKSVSNSIQILQRLPCYQTIFKDRSDLLSKCVYIIPHGIPQLTRQNFHVPTGITFLSANSKLHDLYMYLGCKDLTVTEFYCQHMLHLLETTSNSEERHDHLCFIRDNINKLSLAEHNAIQNFFQTQHPKLFPNMKGDLKMASKLMDPSNPIFCLFHNDDPDFPNKPYNEFDWHNFLIMAGLMHDIQPQGLLVYARQLSLSASQDLSAVTVKAKVLLEYIFDRYNQFEVCTFVCYSQISKLKFVGHIIIKFKLMKFKLMKL